MKSFLPIVLVILLLTGAITYALSKRIVPQADINRFGVPANEFTAPSPTLAPRVTVTPLLPSDTVTPSLPLPTPVLVAEDINTDTNSVTGRRVTLSPSSICTPVYGQANTCTEHLVVDTGAQDAIFYNFAALSYLAGLAAFIKSKYA